LGGKILLPLDLLAPPNVYLPRTPEVSRIIPHDDLVSDLVFAFEPSRQFAVSEIHAGRFPFWAPYQYAGASFVEPNISPLQLLQYLIASPVVVAWLN